MLKAEEILVPFSNEPSAAEILLTTSPEMAKEAGSVFTQLCESLLMEKVENVNFFESEVVPGLFDASLNQIATYEDGSRLTASISTHASRLPNDHIYKFIDNDDPCDVHLSSTGKSSDGKPVFITTKYEFDETTGFVKKKTRDHSQAVQSFVKILEVKPPEVGPDPAMDSLYETLGGALASAPLEYQLKADEYTVVGVDEIAQLGNLLRSLK